MFTGRYALGPYIKQESFAFKGLISILHLDREERSALTPVKSFLYPVFVPAETQSRSRYCGKRKIFAPIGGKVLIFAFVQSLI